MSRQSITAFTTHFLYLNNYQITKATFQKHLHT